MSKFFKPLSTKLSVTLLLVFLVLVSAFFFLSQELATSYLDEVNQRLNKDLAVNVLNNALDLSQGKAGRSAVPQLFHTVMSVNPAVEMYLVGADGTILESSPTKNPLISKQISTKPIDRFLSNELPVYGDDPRDAANQKVFSVARFKDPSNNAVAQKNQDYLYIVLAGQDAKSLKNLLWGSYALRIAAACVAALLSLLFFSALLLINLISRRLNSLVEIIRQFKIMNFSASSPRYQEKQLIRDEISEFGFLFNELADLIGVQFAQLQRSEKIRRELIQNISHDIRRPLTSLLGYAETLQLRDEELTSELRKDYQGRILKSCRSCIQLISELFELSRLETSEDTLKIEAFAPDDLVEDIVQEYVKDCRERDVEIKTEIPEIVPMALADIPLIERVLNNILDNSLSHTPRSGTITVKILPLVDEIEISVSDTGCGLTPEMIPKIFERGFRGNRNVKDGRLGLGLAICKQILELHNTYLSVESEEEKGTIFSFRLPTVKKT